MTPNPPDPSRGSTTASPNAPRFATNPDPNANEDRGAGGLPIIPLIFAWVLPGLGHWLIGERSRGLIVGATIIALFILGLLIGGIDVVDSRNDRLWFMGQVIAGPAVILLDRYHTHLDAHGLPEPSDNPPNYAKSLGRMNELGTLYCTLAGVLNLLAILDLFGREALAPAERALRNAQAPPDPRAGKIITRDT